MSDKEEEWKPKNRPQSTMALSLAAALDDAFMLDSDVDNLANSVHYKKQMVTIQNRELEALEARIREAEERLKNQQGQDGPSGANATANASARPDTAEKTHNPQFSSSSSGSHPSDLGSTGSAPSDGAGYRGAGQDQKEKVPRF